MSDCKVGEQNIIHIPRLDYPLDSRGLGWIFYECMQIKKDKIAQVYGPTGEEDTHGELLQRSIRTVIAMRKLGVEPGDFISLCTINHNAERDPWAMMLDQMMKVKEMFPEIRVHAMYGQSEVPGAVTAFKPGNPKDLEFIKQKPASCGTGMPGISYKIVDPETEGILGPNQEGELRIKAEFQLSGYHNIDSAEVWDSDGWLKTGDIAYYDDDKCFYIVDRIKEMFKFQSWHIAPAILESVLLTHPAVELAMVIGIPHELDGDHPMGIVILKSSHKHVTPKEIEKYVEEKVQDRQRLRAGVKIVDRFPITPSGKISRTKVREMVFQGKI